MSGTESQQLAGLKLHKVISSSRDVSLLYHDSGVWLIQGPSSFSAWAGMRKGPRRMSSPLYAFTPVMTRRSGKAYKHQISPTLPSELAPHIGVEYVIENAQPLRRQLSEEFKQYVVLLSPEGLLYSSKGNRLSDSSPRRFAFIDDPCSCAIPRSHDDAGAQLSILTFGLDAVFEPTKNAHGNGKGRTVKKVTDTLRASLLPYHPAVHEIILSYARETNAFYETALLPPLL